MHVGRFFPALLLLGSCQAVPPPTEPPSEAPRSLVFEMKTKEKTFDGCVAGAAGCAYIRLDYPVVVEAPAGTAVDAVTGIIVDFLGKPLRGGEKTPGIENINTLMDSFIEEYRAFHAASPRSTAVWYLERKAFVLGSESNLLSLSFSERFYLGGNNEPGVTLRFHNLDPKTGAELTLSDLLRPGAEEKLRSLAEARFREARKIEPETGLAAAGFTFEDGAFHLNDNFSLCGKGLTFYYNTSEIGPPALGPTEILLTYADVGELLDPRFLPDEAT